MTGAPTEPAVDSTAIGPEPHGAVAGLYDGRDHAVCKRRQRCEVAMAENVEAICLSADPKVSFSVFDQREDAVVAEFGLKLGHGSGVVETVDALASADPKRVARGGQEGLDAGSI